MPDTIVDGKTGNTAKVERERLFTNAVIIPVATQCSRDGLLFGTGTGNITLSGSESLSQMLWLKCNDPDNYFDIEKLIYGWNGGSTNFNRTALVFIKYQTTVPTANNTDAAPTIENISRSGATAPVTDGDAVAWKWDGVGTNGMTGSTGGYLQIPNRLAQGNTSIPIDGQIILGQGDTMALHVTPEEAGELNLAIVYSKRPLGD